MPRYSLTLTNEERDELKTIAAADGRTMASMMRLVFKRGLHVSISASDCGFSTSEPRQNSVTSASDLQRPSYARAGTDSGERESEREPSIGDRLAEEWKTVEPFCLMRNPGTVLERLQRALPSVDFDAQTALIAQWWDERDYAPSTRKRRSDERWSIAGISAGVRGWLDRSQGPPPRPQLTMLDKPTPLDESQAHSGAYDDNGRWTKDLP